MAYTAQNLSVELFERGLEDHRNWQSSVLRSTIDKAQAFFEGYDKCLSDVIGMLHCCNYEDKAAATSSFLQGADNAFYELCKELDIRGQDIREMKTGIDEKAALLADRIRSAYGNVVEASADEEA